MFKGRTILPVCIALVMVAWPAQANETLTLEQAYALVLERNPQISAYKARIDAAEGNRVQEGLGPNPQAVLEAENFGGSGARKGFDAAEYTLSLEQQVEVAGKRSMRELVATHEKEKARQEAFAGIQSILAQTKSAYMQAVIAQERVNVAAKRAALAQDMHRAVKRRVNAAKSPDIQHTKADIEISAADMEERRAQKEWTTAITTLANLMDRKSLDLSPHADLSALPDAPDQDAMLRTLETTPLSVLSKVMVMRQKAVLDLARANGVPDPTFGLGVRRYSDDDGTAFLASISFPLPVSDRNQGRIAEARANVIAAESDERAQHLALTRQAVELWQSFVSTREEATTYQEGLLPSAQKAYTQAQNGFERGAFTFLDLLDAQRTLFDVQENYLETLAALHETAAQIDMLTGAYASAANTAFSTPADKKE